MNRTTERSARDPGTTGRRAVDTTRSAAGHAHGLRLDATVREDARLRLLSVRGHIEGIARMLEDESVYCVDVLKQIKAVDGALAKVGDLVLRAHLRDHVVTAQRRGDSAAIVEELMNVLKYR